MTIQLCMIDDQVLFREGVARLLSEQHDIRIVGQAANRTEGLALLRQLPTVDVILLEPAAANYEGLELLKDLRYGSTKAPILILSQLSEIIAVRCMKAGASGYLSKHSSPEELTEAIRKLHAGGRYLTQSVGELLATSVTSNGDGQPPHVKLSDREYQLMLFLASGHTMTEAAREFKLSIKTLSTYRTRMLDKLELANDVQVTQYVLGYELIQNPLVPIKP